MKVMPPRQSGTTSYLLGASVALNGALLLALAFGWRSVQGNYTPPLTRPAQLVAPAAVNSPREPSSSKPHRSAEMTWDRIAASDYRAFIANLRAFRVPESTIQDIVAGAVKRQYAPRLAALSNSRVRFWEPVQRQSRSESERKAEEERSQAMHRLEAERNNLVVDLLGVSLEDIAGTAPSPGSAAEDLLSGLAPEARVRTRQVLQRYDTLENDVIARTGGTLGLPEQRELDQLYHAKTAELQAILSPAELEEYELRFSPTANLMRQVQLVGFSPTEQEFRAIFKAVNTFQSQFPSDSRASSDATNLAMLQAALDRDEQIRQALGDARYAEYRRSNDATYRGLIELTDHYGLGQEVAVQIHQYRESVLAQAQAVTQDAALSEAERSAALEEIRRNTEKTISGTLGDEAYQSYVSMRIGRWIDGITRLTPH